MTNWTQNSNFWSNRRLDPHKFARRYIYLASTSKAFRKFFFSIRRGWARTQTPTTRNCTVELPTFAVIAGVSPIWVQWKSLALEDTPHWSDMLPRQVSMLCWANEKQGTPTRFINLVDPEFLQFRIHKLGGQVLVNPHFQFLKLSLLGLMAKIKCSICSYQFNIWYAGHSLAHILIWFLAFGQGSEACLTLTTGCLGVALQPSAAHLSLMKPLQKSFARDSLSIFFPYNSF